MINQILSKFQKTKNKSSANWRIKKSNLFGVWNFDSKPLQTGTSLVEIVIYMAMFSVLLILLLQMFTSILNAQLESQATSEVAIDGRFILSRLAKDIRSANTIVVPSLYGVNGQGSTLRIIGAGVDYTYSLNSGNIVLTNNITTVSGVLNSVDTTVTSLTFTKLGTSGEKSTIQTNFTLNSIARKQTGVESKTFQTTIGTR